MDRETWYQVDNVAKVFLASVDKRDTRSFRVSVILNEDVDPEILQQALDIAAEERPQYQVLIRRGIFWHYMEGTNRTVKVAPETRRPCPTLYSKQSKGKLHYEVTYYKKRINLEMFHALTDGNGGLEFLNIILVNYIQLKYPEAGLEHLLMRSGASADDLDEDSFKQFYGKEKSNVEPAPKAPYSYQISGMKLPYDQLQFFEIHMPTAEILKRAKAANATVTSFLGAKLMLAIFRDMPVSARKKPITISMPVNLRNFYDSSTSRNFFNSVYVSHYFDGTETVESLAAEFDKALKKELEPEVVRARMNDYEKLEQLLFVRMVPLFIKNPIVAFAARKERKRVTAVISNLGRIQVPEEIKPYVKGYNAFCSTGNLFTTVSTFDEDLCLGVASTYKNTGVLKDLIRSFTEDGVEATVFATEVVR